MKIEVLMKNKQNNRLFDKSLKLVIATIFSFSLINSPLLFKLTDISEFESVAYAKKSKEDAIYHEELSFKLMSFIIA